MLNAFVQTANTLLEILESRLDVAVYRLKFAPTIFASHQLVSHGHVMVDGKKVTIRSYLVKPGQVISIREKSQKSAMIKESLESPMREIPS